MTLLEAVRAILREVGLQRERKARTTARDERSLRAVLGSIFLEQAGAVLTALPESWWNGVQEAAPAEDASGRIDKALESYEARGRPMGTALRQAAQTAMGEGYAAAASDLGAIGLSFDVQHPDALAYFDAVGVRRVAGINETTRNYLRTVIRDGLAHGTPYNEIARNIVNRFAEFGVPSPLGHIRSRAELIAVTELGEAYSFGTWKAAKDLQRAGLGIEKHWLTAGDSRVDQSICRNNESANWLDLDTPFPSGHQRPLGHPGCRCDMQTRVALEGEPEVTKRIPYPGFDNLADAERWAKSQYPDIEWHFHGHVISNTNPALQRFDDLAQRFPEVTSRLKRVGSFAGGEVNHKNAVAWARFDGTEMWWNPKYFGQEGYHAGAVARQRQAESIGKTIVGFKDGNPIERVALPWHPKGTGGLDYVMTHEWGHLVEGYYTGFGKSPMPHTVTLFNGLSTTGQAEARSMVQELLNLRAPNLSQYAKSSRSEKFAEAFGQMISAPEKDWHPYTRKVANAMEDLRQVNWRTDAPFVRDMTQEDRDVFWRAVDAMRKRWGLKER